MTTKNFYDSLNEMVTDARFRQLTVSQNFENFFNSYGFNETENMYALGWFMNPKGTHGFNDIFFKEMVTSAWTMIHGQYGINCKNFKTSSFYTALSPVYFQQRNFTQAFVDREICKTYPCADMVISDVDSKIMVVINNRYEAANCNKAYSYFTSDKFNYFQNKLFITLDGSIQSGNDTQWMYMNNEWLINLCTNLLDCPQYCDNKTASYLKDYYQFLTGTQYGVSQESVAEYASTIVSDYYQVLNDLRNYKAEKISDVCLIDINPRDYAGMYWGKISEKEYGVLSLYWSYRNTFTTFFQLANLESVTRNMEKFVANKSYRFDRTFIRNGLRFTPNFSNVRNEYSFMNRIFDVEIVQDSNKNMNMCLVVNKSNWDRMTHVQREAIQKNFGFTSVLLNDRVVVWNNYYGQNWMNKDLSTEIGPVFEKVASYLTTAGFKVA